MNNEILRAGLWFSSGFAVAIGLMVLWSVLALSGRAALDEERRLERCREAAEILEAYFREPEVPDLDPICPVLFHIDKAIELGACAEEIADEWQKTKHQPHPVQVEYLRQSMKYKEQVEAATRAKTDKGGE